MARARDTSLVRTDEALRVPADLPSKLLIVVAVMALLSLAFAVARRGHGPRRLSALARQESGFALVMALGMTTVLVHDEGAIGPGLPPHVHHATADLPAWLAAAAGAARGGGGAA